MEASNMVMMMNPSSSSCCLKKPATLTMMGFSPSVSFRRRNSLIRCGGEKKKVKLEEKVEKKNKKKKGGKLLKGLSRDLSMFYGMGFGLDSEYYGGNKVDHEGLADQNQPSLVDQVKLKMMSEAAELLLEQLKQVRAEEKELKKKMKMEEKKKRKSEQKSTNSVSCLESPSESSDSEFDNEVVVYLNGLKLECGVPPRMASVPSIPTLQENVDVSLLPTTAAGEVEMLISGCGYRLDQEKSRLGEELGGMVGKKIEVCMGGKCKKSGAATLMEEFQRVVGLNDDIVVSGCKCMGKCRDGPNVRLVNSLSSEAAPMPVAKAATPGNPLCLGVGVEDVGLIVANFFGDETHRNGNLFDAAIRLFNEPKPSQRFGMIRSEKFGSKLDSTNFKSNQMLILSSTNIESNARQRLDSTQYMLYLNIKLISILNMFGFSS